MRGLVAADGSDLHLASGQPPRYGVAGSISPVAGEPPIPAEQVDALLQQITPPDKWEAYQHTGDADFAYTADGIARFRVNIGRARGTTSAFFRHISDTPPSLEDLGVPSQIKSLAAVRSGMVVFVGETGAGKSSTLAGLVSVINRSRDGHIVTLEDPIEYIHEPIRCQITQREIGTDTPSFEEGMRHVRRQNPNVIMLGEMRDYETIHYAMEAADSGHLVLTTLHANSAAETISRIINTFPEGRQNQVRVTLASVLKAVVFQTLLPSDVAPRGRALACEILISTPGIASAIRDNMPGEIRNAMTNREHGSMPLDTHLVELVRTRKITEQVALAAASSEDSFRRFFSASLATT